MCTEEGLDTWRIPSPSLRLAASSTRSCAGAVVDVELLPVAEGGTVELDRVLLLSQDGQVTVGTPTVAGAKVRGDRRRRNVRGDKIIVFKYKAKTRQRNKTGHRQNYTRLAIKEIVAG